MRIDRLGALGTPAEVLRAVSAGAARRGLAPPAALTGEWFGARAVIAPSVSIEPVSADEVFPVPTAGPSDAVGGGWIGGLSFPAGGVWSAVGGWTDCVLRCDAAGLWWYESLTDSPLPGWLDEALVTPSAPKPWRIDWTPPDRDVHRAGVVACLEAIAAGEVYQACVCTRFSGTLRGASVDFFADAVASTSPARAAYLSGSWGAVASLSPELFLHRCGQTVTSSPIKGTLPLHAEPALLRDSVKDVAENIMIVDLVRNDLGRVATMGSVAVPELLAVRPAPGVWHLVSTVSAHVPEEVAMRDLLAATFPPASVTGTPKLRALELLSQWEPHARGVYCGAIGLASPVAGTELNVAIRTVEFDHCGRAVLGVGGGITADSQPDAEWQECLDKAAPTIGLSSAADSARRGSPPAVSAR